MSKSLKEFLQCLKSKLFQEQFKHGPVYIVCGNSSADLDSVASALTYAYCSYNNNPKHPIIPIIGIPRLDLHLRRDIVWALERMNITEDMLFFLEDLQHLKNEYGLLHAVLVDHNQLESGVRPYVEKVTGIIDHHKDEHLYPSADPREITKTGSCSSLVFNYWNQKLANPYSLKEVACLSLGAALIDTSNFKYKVEQSDIDASHLYSKLLLNMNEAQYYEKLRQEKDNLKGFTIQDILRKDYKEFLFETSENNKLRVGIASVVKPLEWFHSTFKGEECFEKACSSAERKHEVDIFLVLTAWVNNGEFKRELALTSTSVDKESLLEILKYLRNKLQLELIRQESDGPHFFSFRQLDVAASRKQVAPTLKDAIKFIQLP
ncbi:hypothetical protein HG535_0H04180 [Zygotorulaspora mrakii]|uniref:DHHA2 domain-containing protein n=1 Tax=Zygotorulaspora mrakii TaxID=42260 RepID=A0A7H9B8K2_ZYGMR|nr:uncharacterized protein HG535_0H04180 [Zygotorulaspora mrakii]QLG75091.1 hypothetical protein HG535_0H04180 [Zygotorulaspora mrakii]